MYEKMKLKVILDSIEKTHRRVVLEEEPIIRIGFVDKGLEHLSRVIDGYVVSDLKKDSCIHLDDCYYCVCIICWEKNVWHYVLSKNLVLIKIIENFTKIVDELDEELYDEMLLIMEDVLSDRLGIKK